jgi:ferrous iron transport protein B
VIVGLVGNPNCGKTTLFNALTGARQRVGNWPGVTVERKSGFFKQGDKAVEVVDLPGTYSLISENSVDEHIACEFIANRQADVIVNIVDASQLERHLYLTLQLIEMRVPMIIALNMMDVARKRNLHIWIEKLEKNLGVPVVVLEAHRARGILELKKKILEKIECSDVEVPYPEVIKETIVKFCLAQQDNNGTSLRGASFATKQSSSFSTLTGLLRASALAMTASMPLSRHNYFTLPETIFLQNENLQKQIQEKFGEDADILIADARYRFIQKIISDSVVKSKKIFSTWTSYLDRIVLNRILGIPIFLAVMYCMFLFAINIGGAFQDFFDISSNTIFVEGFAQLLATLHAPNGLIALLANGVGRGINTTVTFIPVIGAMFLFLAVLEDSGYMSRAAFVVDRLMRALGLPGKSFVPMIIGFGCNVPAVMAARTLENKRDRILTAMMTPFMSCGARLAIYAVFTAAFFPVGGQNVVFSLYLIGILIAVLTGFILRKTILKGEPAPLLMELPPYHVPNLKTIFLHAWQRLKSFVFRAGKLIVPICILIGALNAFNIDGTVNAGEGDANSLLSHVGRFATPIFAPMGMHEDNWPATVGLVTGVLAKEVVVGTLNTLYSQLGNTAMISGNVFHFWGGLHDAAMSIPANLAQIGNSLGNPVLATAPVHTLSQSVYGIMYEKFDGQIGAMAYLLFVLLYVPCISTIAAISRELSRGWAIFSACWSTGIAYTAAVGFYQAATFMQHPMNSFLWLMMLAISFALTIFAINFTQGGRYELARH